MKKATTTTTAKATTTTAKKAPAKKAPAKKAPAKKAPAKAKAPAPAKAKAPAPTAEKCPKPAKAKAPAPVENAPAPNTAENAPKPATPWKNVIPVEISERLCAIIAQVGIKPLATKLNVSSASITRWAYRRRGKRPVLPHAKFATYTAICNACTEIENAQKNGDITTAFVSK